MFIVGGLMVKGAGEKFIDKAVFQEITWEENGNNQINFTQKFTLPDDSVITTKLTYNSKDIKDPDEFKKTLMPQIVLTTKLAISVGLADENPKVDSVEISAKQLKRFKDKKIIKFHDKPSIDCGDINNLVDQRIRKIMGKYSGPGKDVKKYQRRYACMRLIEEAGASSPKPENPPIDQPDLPGPKKAEVTHDSSEESVRKFASETLNSGFEVSARVAPLLVDPEKVIEARKQNLKATNKFMAAVKADEQKLKDVGGDKPQTWGQWAWSWVPGTGQEAVKLSGESEKLKKYLQSVALHQNGEDQLNKGTEDILGRFDVLRLPAIMHFDESFDAISEENMQKANHFYVHSTIFPGLEELEQGIYDNNGQFVENHYIDRLEKVFLNNFTVLANDKIEDAVCDVFGMDGFFKELAVKYPKYQEGGEALENLRAQIAERFVNAYQSKGKDFNIHICLPMVGDGGHDDLNARAFLATINNHLSDDLKKKMQLHINQDKADVAQKLSNGKGESYKVSVVNSCNRKLLGGRWFDPTVEGGFEENFVRRAPVFACLVNYLNEGMKVKERDKDYLKNKLTPQVV